MLISKMVRADSLPVEVKGDLPVTPDMLLRVTVEIPSGQQIAALDEEQYLSAIHKISDGVRSAPLLDSRPANEMLYDEHGLPK